MTTPRDPNDVRVLVAMPSYGDVELALASIRSLVPQREGMPGIRVGICENGTGEHAPRQLLDAIRRERWQDWVYVHEISPNRGFAGGTNVILRDGLAQGDAPDYFWLLNSDTLVEPGAARALVAAMEADPSLGIVTPRLLARDGAEQQCTFRDKSPRSEFLRAAATGTLNRLLGRAASELELPEAAPPEWVCFAAALVRREVVAGVGLLDEGYFLYGDDCDYCWRARRAGWKLGLCAGARVVHLEGASSNVPQAGRLRQRRPRYYYVSRARYFAKRHGAAGLWLANAAFMAGHGVALTRHLLGGKMPQACAGEWRDNWINCLGPLRRSEPRPHPETGIDRVLYDSTPAVPPAVASSAHDRSPMG